MIVSDAETYDWKPTKITNRSSDLFAWCQKPVAEGYKVETSSGSRIWYVAMTGRYDLIASGCAMYLKTFFFEAILVIFRRKRMR